MTEKSKITESNTNLKTKYKSKSKLYDFDEKVSDLLKRINNGIDSSNKIVNNEDFE